MASESAYGAAAVEVAELFSDYLEGDASRPALALSHHELEADSRSAIEKSLDFFGYPRDSCTFATLLPKNAAVEGSNIPLDSQALFLLVEGLDPLFVIATDDAATSALGEAYRTALPAEASTRVFGRPAATFHNLSALLATQAGRQKAWSILKPLSQ